MAIATCLASACSVTADPTTTGPAPTSSTSVAAPSSSTTSNAEVTTPTAATTTTTAQPRPPLPIELADSTFATTYGEFGPIAPLPDGTDDAIGSGCTVDGPLPDGIWFGHILEYAIPPGTTEVAFDLACVVDYDPEFRSWSMTNTEADVRNVPIHSVTRFVLTRRGSIRFEQDGVTHITAQVPWTIVRPQDASEELTDEAVHGHDWLWGWALVEDGVMVEFFDTRWWRIRHATHVVQESAIPDLVFPSDRDDYQQSTAEDGFDGSGCSPESDAESVPDGTWFGYVTHDSPRDIRFDLLCMTSNPDMWDRLGLDPLDIEDRTYVDDGDPTEYELTIASDAVLHLTSIDHYLMQTSLTIDDPRYVHLIADARYLRVQTEDNYVPRRTWWVTVEDGVVTEAYVPFSA